jgi:hypothetical protein
VIGLTGDGQRFRSTPARGTGRAAQTASADDDSDGPDGSAPGDNYTVLRGRRCARRRMWARSFSRASRPTAATTTA